VPQSSLEPTTALGDLRDAGERAPDPLGRETRFVFGEGDPNARLMLVGEAPGGDEDRLGRPFVGAAGRLLDRVLAAAGIERSAVWISNVVKRRPTAPGAGRLLKNRPPTTAEIAADRRWVDAEIAAIRPAIVVCLGAVAANALVHPRFRLGAERGQVQAGPSGCLALATYHPSYVMRFHGDEFDRVFGEVVSDLVRAKSAAEIGEHPVGDATRDALAGVVAPEQRGLGGIAEK
jgi:uracil-DNA glycosylase family 4